MNLIDIDIANLVLLIGIVLSVIFGLNVAIFIHSQIIIMRFMSRRPKVPPIPPIPPVPKLPDFNGFSDTEPDL